MCVINNTLKGQLIFLRLSYLHFFFFCFLLYVKFCCLYSNVLSFVFCCFFLISFLFSRVSYIIWFYIFYICDIFLRIWPWWYIYIVDIIVLFHVKISNKYEIEVKGCLYMFVCVVITCIQVSHHISVFYVCVGIYNFTQG